MDFPKAESLDVLRDCSRYSDIIVSLNTQNGVQSVLEGSTSDFGGWRKNVKCKRHALIQVEFNRDASPDKSTFTFKNAHPRA